MPRHQTRNPGPHPTDCRAVAVASVSVMRDKRPPRRPTAVDLFAGAGGLSLGLEQAGFDVLASVEYDAVHAATHAFNFPLTEVLTRSVAEVTGDDIRNSMARGWAAHHPGEDWDGQIDLVAGGPPCQGFSWIGKRQVDDSRNDLIFHFWRVIHELRPKYFLMENVPGMLSGAHKSFLLDLLERFDADGYKVQPPTILSASHFGVPQARRRLILIGTRADQSVAEYPEPSTRPAAGKSDAGTDGLSKGPTVSDAIGDLPDLDSYKALLQDDRVPLSARTVAKMDRMASSYARQLRGLDQDQGDFSHTRVWNPSLLTSSRRTIHTALSVERFADTKPGSVEEVSRFLRLEPAGLCNTLRAGTGSERGAHTSPRPIHPVSARVISVREAARLHSFPDWFRLHSTKWHGFRQVGNAVPPLLGRAIGASIIAALGIVPQKPTEVLPPGNDALLHMNMAQAARHLGVPLESLPKQRNRQKIS